MICKFTFDGMEDMWHTLGLKNTYKILCRRCEGRTLFVDIGGTIILKWILKLKQDCLLDSAGPGQGPVTGCCK
jgi:predicted methyltransferase